MSSFNGSGVFSISGTGLPYVFNTTISETVANQLNTDLATGLSNCICKDGQSTPTANIKLGGFKLTNVGAATATNDALTYGTGANQSSLLAPTRQVLLSGSGATYTTPSLCRQLRIRMVGGGGGGGGSSSSTDSGNGGGGGFSSFDNGGTNYKANGGSGGTAGISTGNPGGGAGGTGGTGGSSPNTIRVKGGGGGAGGAGLTNGTESQAGGSSALGGGAPGSVSTGIAGGTNSGGGGSGGAIGATGYSGGSGGGGEYAEIIINNPISSYTYTVGAGGSAGTIGTGGLAGGAGGSGVIIVDEFY